MNTDFSLDDSIPFEIRVFEMLILGATHQILSLHLMNRLGFISVHQCSSVVGIFLP